MKFLLGKAKAEGNTHMAAEAMTNPNSHERKEAIHLEDIVNECKETKATWGLVQNDIAFAVAFWAMIDCGFESLRSAKTSTTIEDKSQFALPENWKHKTRQMYEAHFVLPPYFENPVKLVALPAEDILCMNAIVSNISSRNVNLKSLAIHSSGYVPRPEESSLVYKFSAFHDFHLLLRNSIIWPIRCSILTDQGVTNGSLCGLSDEIKLKIIRQLTVGEILMLSQTCHDLNRICNDQSLWKYMFHDKFKGNCKCSKESTECDEACDWKENFKQAYSEKRGNECANVRDSPSESYHTAHDAPFGSEIDLGID